VTAFGTPTGVAHNRGLIGGLAELSRSPDR